MQSLLRLLAPYSIALSIAYLATVLLLWRADLTRLDAILEEVEQVRASIPAILEEVAQVRASIPVVEAQVAAVVESVPALLAESRALRAQLPALLAEVNSTRATVDNAIGESAAIRQSLPPVLRELEAWRQTIPGLRAEARAFRALVPPVLEEVEATRDALPPLMDRAEQMIAAAESAGREASKGAVTGVFTGLISAPFSLMRGIGESVLGTSELNDADMKLLRQSGYTVLNSPSPGVAERWSNTRTGVSGRTYYQSSVRDSKGNCHVLHFSARKKNRTVLDKDVTVCQDAKGEWRVQEPETESSN